MMSIVKQPIVFPYCGNNRRKFTFVDDCFLYVALRQLGTCKDLNSIHENWLSNKNVNEVKHRIKNLTCSRAPDNVIRRWKQEHLLPLRQGLLSADQALGAKQSIINKQPNNESKSYYNEIYLLALGIYWFGIGSLDQQSENMQYREEDLMTQFSRWNQISRFFVPSRSGEFLKLEYQNIIRTPEK